MTKYIKIYDNALSADLCSRLINNFSGHGLDTHEFYDDEYKRFNQLTLHHDDFKQKELIDELLVIMQSLYMQYVQDTQLEQYQIPKKIGYEGLRIKKYYDAECEFKPHVDVVDYDSSKRFMSFLFYLNSTEDGDTIFFDQNLKVKPVLGRVVMFPPLWCYPHQGSKSSQDKYILSTYLNFVQ